MHGYFFLNDFDQKKNPIWRRKLKEILPTLWKMHVKIGMSIDMVKFMLCLQWGKIGLIPQLWHLIVGKPVSEICTVPSSECFTLGNHPTSSRAPALKPRDFRSENIARKRSKPHTKALVGKFLLVSQSAFRNMNPPPLTGPCRHSGNMSPFSEQLHGNTVLHIYVCPKYNNSAETLSEG
jgi:hypothetical protein